MASGNRVVMTVNQRMDVLKDLQTFSAKDVAKKYNVHPSTIWRIQQSATKITDFVNKGQLEKQRKTIRKPKYEELEARLYVWFIEMRTIGTAMSDALLLKKANELKKEFGACSDFKVSTGWIAKFKKRHRIRLVRIYGEKDRSLERTADEGNEERSADEGNEERPADERNEERPADEGNEGRLADEENEERLADEGNEERLADEDNEDRLADEDNEDRLADEGNEERLADEGNEERLADEENEERLADEENEEHGIKLPRNVRKKLEDAFQCFESYKNYLPRSVLCHLDGIKLTILGDTT